MNDGQVKLAIEKLHTTFLCDTFGLTKFTDLKLTMPGLCDGSGNILLKPDLAGRDDCLESVFELKSRTYPHEQDSERQRVQSDFEWWPLDRQQIKNYEKFSGLNKCSLYWILILGHMEKMPTTYESIDEDIIQLRDIYVLPWDTYKLANKTAGDCYRLGLSKIKKANKFTQELTIDYVLNISKSIDDKIGRYFLKA